MSAKGTKKPFWALAADRVCFFSDFVGDALVEIAAMAVAVVAVTVSAVILSIRAWTPGGIPVAVAAPLPANEASKVAMTPFSASRSAW
ncbi:hypothetical protein BS47DRAFT_1402304 [Hydnum rufescens UP504]|uniref:Uncharacterized protein n=1 Tax=Hydnum rufescens UP504 TaxID=1448309 RepID=A0A9P6ACR8_9AGAM|nr:hypothetical protein BS47DRAFT_1402304 [Hydnum rufescens UP504]